MTADTGASGFEIRLATAGDLNAILGLERSIPTAPHWPVATYQAVLQAANTNFSTAGPRRCLLVAVDSGAALLGFAAGVLQTTGQAELETVAVAASARRQGIGTRLCSEVVDWARTHGATELLLEVRASSEGAIRLYRELRFEEIGRRPDYYRHPNDDAAIMRLPLT